MTIYIYCSGGETSRWCVSLCLLYDEPSLTAEPLVRFCFPACREEEPASDCLPGGIFGELGLFLGLKSLRMWIFKKSNRIWVMDEEFASAQVWCESLKN